MMITAGSGARSSQGIVKTWRCKARISGCFLALFAISMFVISASFPASAQSTTGTGSIQGTVTDQSGAVVAGAKVTITNKSTAAVMHLTASASGSYSTGPIQPGDYFVHV